MRTGPALLAWLFAFASLFGWNNRDTRWNAGAPVGPAKARARDILAEAFGKALTL